METLVKKIIVERLMLPIEPESISSTVALFDSDQAGGLGLDSLAALEILAGLSEHYQDSLEDVEPADFRTVSALVAYLQRRGLGTGNGQ